MGDGWEGGWETGGGRVGARGSLHAAFVLKVRRVQQVRSCDDGSVAFGPERAQQALVLRAARKVPTVDDDGRVAFGGARTGQRVGLQRRALVRVVERVGVPGKG